jgi:RNA polymerase sigma factor (sigma-70 family)
MTRKKVTARIGRANYRRLPAFEKCDDWHSVYFQELDGRVSEPIPELNGIRLPISARGFNCADCGSFHPLPALQTAKICPRLPNAEARIRAIGYIDGEIARARGQPPQASEAILEDIAAEIVGWPERYREIVDEYRQHPLLEPYIRELEDVPLPDGDNVRPPPELGEMISNNLHLVESLAKRRARTVSNVTGWLATDDALYSDLEAVGMQALEEAAHRYDRTRGVPFEAFARIRVAGAMDNYLKRERIPTIGGDGYDAALDGANLADDQRTSKAAKRHRSSTGAYKEKTPYISTSAQPVHRPDGSPTTRLIRRTINQDMEAALAKLNHRQQVVYRGRVLSDPPVARSVLAAQLGVDERQIPRILQQAERKMRSFLKVSPPR